MTIYLDVDGVLNALDPFRLSDHTPGAETWPDFTEHDVSLNEGGGLIQKFRLHLSQQMAAALWDVVDGDIIWHTTWNQGPPHSNKKISPLLGWPTLPYLPYKSWHRDSWWKLDVIREADLPEKFVWIDDDFAYELEAQKWATEKGGLWIAPDPRVGITPDHIERIADYYG